MMRRLQRFLNTPMRDRRALGVALVVALAFIAIPDLIRPNDWELNTADLWRGLDLYDNPNYVYPPWALILMQPYRLMTAAGARVLSILVVVWLVSQRDWSLGTFLSIVLNPFMVYAALFSNLDLLVLTLPILLWESSSTMSRLGGVVRGLAIALMLLKPQGAILVLPYLFWRSRDEWRQSGMALIVATVLIFPISLVGSPPLLVSWIENITNASPQNQTFWLANNVSLTNLVGLPVAALLLCVGFGACYWMLRRVWGHNHSLLVALLSAMLLSPYTSHQSLIAAFVFAPSWPASVLLLGLSVVAEVLQLYESFVGLWILGFGMVALFFSVANHSEKETEPRTMV